MQEMSGDRKSYSVPTPQRVRLAIARVEAGLLERTEHARMLVLCALCGEHLLLIGPPGTAKSELARRLHRVFGGRYFERLLTRFTVPEELFGPLSRAALDEGRYERDIAGYLPDSTIAFLDEVFKGNSAILNALLTLLNEREFDQGPHRIATPLVSVVAASNEVPDDETLRAFEDRFMFRCTVAPVSDERFDALLDIDPDRPVGVEEALLARDDIEALAHEARRVRIGSPARKALVALRHDLRDKAIEVSDRRWVRATRALRIAALLNGSEEVGLEDLWVLKALISDCAETAAWIEGWYCAQLGAGEVVDPLRCARIVQAFEKQLELEASATELAFDDSGKLSVMQRMSAADDDTLASAAPRMSAFSRLRRYSPTHIAARIRQIDEALSEFDAFLGDADEHIRRVLQQLSRHLWVPELIATRVGGTLEETVDKVRGLRTQLLAVRQLYEALPVADNDDGRRPPPVEFTA